MTQEIIEHHKTITIPVCMSDKTPIFLTVRDRRFKDWIFIAGGCRKREVANPIRCALRELEEETRGVVNIRSGEYTAFSFKTKNRTETELKVDASNNVDVIYNYTVYILFMQYDDIERNMISRKFHEERIKTEQLKQLKLPVRRTHDENDKLAWDSLDVFKAKQQWETIQTHVLGNPEFYECLYSSNKLKFNNNISQ
jgi:8-oxo-dGTP pyrophosphatase MutT (NUDIX family)